MKAIGWLPAGACSVSAYTSVDSTPCGVSFVALVEYVTTLESGDTA